MARIAGVNLPDKKKVWVGLCSIHGIGRVRAMFICKKLGFSDDLRVHQLTDENVSEIRAVIDENFQVEGDLRRTVSANIKRYMDLGCYRGVRHRKHLPLRGQRTHTNARTRKGKAVAIAGKKK